MQMDPNIPIKLLFLVNGLSFKNVIDNYSKKLSYIKGGSYEIGKKLEEINSENASSKKYIQESLGTERNLNPA